MGHGEYDYEARATRARSSGFADAKASDARVFRQAALRRVNQGMDSALIELRECRDNTDHPNTWPVVLALDITGSMGQIPVDLVRHDLPKLMEKLLQIHPDISLCFMAVGDHEFDLAPLQVGQFEASDEKLDHWLTHTWIEGGGGSNPGESYALPWMFAAASIATDAWDKRGQKGLLITIGDEPVLPNYPAGALQKYFGEQTARTCGPYQGVATREAIFEKASEKWEIHHVAMRARDRSWECVGQHFHQVPKSPSVVEIVAKIVGDHIGLEAANPTLQVIQPTPPPAGIPDPI